ncbi:hypothetical protein CXB51_025531 [Gossypium anomalum]|uniref:F-box domain-containing protein n=1 Tax=Gossypium anomalum TaxID=47600 RepID=A0A8J5YAE6_9ROSI|nr:hypothetical protein CXB51_025531 [Gossypium anomalum]
MGIFPDEVILQILARLPVKPLFKTKTVCKTLVSAKNPMVLIETSGSPESRSSLVCVDNLRGVSEVSLDFLKDRVKVRASCNGLLCCSSIPDKGVYYVCNPMTRDFKLLPRCRERPVTRFYPDGEATLVGYHRTFGHRPDGTFICLIFDSDSNNLFHIEDDHFTHMNKNQVVFVNGALHWLPVVVPIYLHLILIMMFGGRFLCLMKCIRGLVPGIFPIAQTGECIFLATHKQILVYHQKSRVWKEMYSVKNSASLPLWFSHMHFGAQSSLLIKLGATPHCGSQHMHFGSQSSLLIKQFLS